MYIRFKFISLHWFEHLFTPRHWVDIQRSHLHVLGGFIHWICTNIIIAKSVISYPGSIHLFECGHSELLVTFDSFWASFWHVISFTSGKRQTRAFFIALGSTRISNPTILYPKSIIELICMYQFLSQIVKLSPYFGQRSTCSTSLYFFIRSIKSETFFSSL